MRVGCSLSYTSIYIQLFGFTVRGTGASDSSFTFFSSFPVLQGPREAHAGPAAESLGRAGMDRAIRRQVSATINKKGFFHGPHI